MWRAASWALLAMLALPLASWAQGDDKKAGDKKEAGKTKIEGEIKSDDPKVTLAALPNKPQHPSKVHEYKMTKGQTVTIRLNSVDKNYNDPYLIVQDSAKKEVAFNDDDPDNPGTLNSKLVFTADKDDTFLIVVTSFDNSIGKYELLIEPATGKAKQLNDLQNAFKTIGDELGKQFMATASDAEKEQIKNRFFELMAEHVCKLSDFADANAGDPEGKNVTKQIHGMLLQLGTADSPAIARHLQILVEKSKNKDIRAIASLTLAENLGKQSETAFRKKDRNQAAKLSQEAIALAELVAEKHPDVQTMQGPLGGKAKDLLFTLTKLSVGKTAPDMDGELMDGKKFKLTDFRGKVTVVYFWGSWCGPCKAMIPHEREMAKKYEKSPFAFVGINTDNDREKAKDFMQKEEITWTQVWDGGVSPGDGPHSKGWKTKAFPTIYVLDGNGVIRLRAIGDPGRVLEETIQECLAEMKQ